MKHNQHKTPLVWSYVRQVNVLIYVICGKIWCIYTVSKIKDQEEKKKMNEFGSSNLLLTERDERLTKPRRLLLKEKIQGISMEKEMLKRCEQRKTKNFKRYIYTANVKKIGMKPKKRKMNEVLHYQLKELLYVGSLKHFIRRWCFLLNTAEQRMQKKERTVLLKICCCWMQSRRIERWLDRSKLYTA